MRIISGDGRLSSICLTNTCRTSYVEAQLYYEESFLLPSCVKSDRNATFQAHRMAISACDRTPDAEHVVMGELLATTGPFFAPVVASQSAERTGFFIRWVDKTGRALHEVVIHESGRSITGSDLDM